MIVIVTSLLSISLIMSITYLQCTSAPPRSSAVTISPVAAFTNGGPPKKIVPLPNIINIINNRSIKY